MLRRCSRGGVPVFSRPIAKPTDRSESARLLRRRFAGAARRPLLVADVDEAVQERARRDDERAARRPRSPSSNARPVTRPLVDQDPAGAPEQPGDVGLGRERLAHPRAVRALVGLRARRPDRRPAAAIEQLELNAGGVDGAGPSGRRARRFRGPDGPWPSRRWPDCRASAPPSRPTACTRPTRQPSRAAAHAASQPAWPAPMTTTSKVRDRAT